jgi:hypothetical protein
MRCAAEIGQVGRLVLAGLLAAVALAACSSGQPNSGPSSKNFPPGSRGLPGRHGFIAINVGGGGGAGVAILAGGVPNGGSGRPKISVGPIPPVTSNKPISLPLDSYEEVAGLEQNAISAAAALLMQKCMTQQGFQFTAAPGASGAVSLLQQVETGYGMDSLPQAEQYGYGQPGEAGPGGKGGPAGPGALILPGLLSGPGSGQHSVAWLSALLGFAPGERLGKIRHQGCFQWAYTELYGSTAGGLGLSVAISSDPVPAIAGEAASWTQSDPRITAADSAWSKCMAEHGYSYRNPQAAADKNWPSAPTSVEIATTVADVTCKNQVNLVNTWLSVEAAYQRALITQNLASLAHLQTAFQANLMRAQDILDNPGIISLGTLPGGPGGPGVRVGGAPAKARS